MDYYKLLIIKEAERERVLNRAKQYYEINKDRIRDQARNKYRELSEGKKI